MDADGRGTENPEGWIETPVTLSADRQILALAVPALGALVAEPLFTLADSAMVGHLGTDALAGLSVGATVLTTVVGVCIFLAYSTTALAARALGAGRAADALRAGVHALWLAAGLGAALAAALAAAASPLLAALGAHGPVLAQGSAYLRGSAPGLVGMLVVLAATGALRGMLDTRTPLAVAAGGAALNVALNWLLIYPARLGILGSGIGTALTQTLMGAALAGVVVRDARRTGVPLGPSLAGIGRAAADGLPLFVRTVALRLAILATVGVATRAGTSALAAHQVAMALWNFAGFALDALAIAAQAMVGFDLGRGDRAHLRRLVRRLCAWGAAAGAAIGALFAVGARWAPALFGPDPAMHAAAARALSVAAGCMPVAGVLFLLDGVLIGAQAGRQIAVASVVALAAYLAPLGALTRWIAQAAPPAALSDAAQANALGWLWVAFAGFFMAARLAGDLLACRATPALARREPAAGPRP